MLLQMYFFCEETTSTLTLNISINYFGQQTTFLRRRQQTKHQNRERQSIWSRYSLRQMQEQTPKHFTKMQRSVCHPVRVQASCLGPGRVLFVSQILKEQEAFSVPKPADRQGALKAPNRARHRALKPTKNSALWG